MSIYIYGIISDPEFQRSKLTAEAAQQKNPSITIGEIKGMFTFDYEVFILQKLKELGGKALSHKESPLVYLVHPSTTEYIGGSTDFVNWVKAKYSFSDARPYPLLEALAKASYKKLIDSSVRTYCFFEISVEGVEGIVIPPTSSRAPRAPASRGTKLGEIVFELYDDICPKTCANFRALCTGENGPCKYIPKKNLHYLSTKVNRIVPRGWIQGGDIGGELGSTGESIYGQSFEDENFIVKHTHAGILGMANNGKPHTNSSQWYITLGDEKMEWMDSRYVAFGRAVEGYSLIKQLESLKLKNERPIGEVFISNCGVYMQNTGPKGASSLKASTAFSSKPSFKPK
eukprot:TRINITY_DN2042_c0_g2_i1.p1 TRINITY_DN2042_c0_g2~~TRINITY_DN2042_c0_g2_i1.p1  ORF type:complete len:343 (+),score=60.20 TRINITY_DN2042_c0_g2_i1:125-1153(+)